MPIGIGIAISPSFIRAPVIAPPIGDAGSPLGLLLAITKS
jgi:hypothetical protein